MSNLNPEQFKADNSSKGSPKMTAKCGHEDPLGYFAGTVCGKCARKNHKKAMGK